MSGKNVNEIEKREQAAAAAGGPTYYTQSYQLSTQNVSEVAVAHGRFSGSINNDRVRDGGSQSFVYLLLLINEVEQRNLIRRY